MNITLAVRGLLGIFASSCVLAACAAPLGEEAVSRDDEEKKKVEPTGGKGALELLAPDGIDPKDFGGRFRFSDSWILLGERIERVPGTYTLTNALNQSVSVTIEPGVVSQYKLGGVRVRYAEPRPTLGDADIVLGGSSLIWLSKDGGEFAFAYTLEGKVRLTTSADAAPIEFIAAQGVVEDITLPTARVTMTLDPYDASYPTPDCMRAYISAGSGGYTQGANVRNNDGSAGAWVVPQGSTSPVRLKVGEKWGETKPTISGQEINFKLNRLEIDDIEVTRAGGGFDKVKGKVRVGRKNGSGVDYFTCEFPTHSGLDVADGVYVVRSTAHTPNGLIEHEAEVSFP